MTELPSSPPAPTSEAPGASPRSSQLPMESLTEEELTARLQDAAKEQRMSKKRDLLQAIERGESVTIPAELLSDGEARYKRLRSDNWGKIQLPPPRCKGKNYAELRTFFIDIEAYFQTQRDAFDDEAKKVFYATACLEGDIKQRWTSYLEGEKKDHLHQITWTELKEWLTDQIKDPTTRCFEATSKLQNAVQGPNQPFSEFHRYYEAIEWELPERLPEKYRICNFIHHLKPALKEYLLKSGIPKSWSQLVSQGNIAESLLKGNRENQRRGALREPQNTVTPPEISGEDPTKDNGSYRPTCWKCGRPHYKTTCKAPDCSHCGSSGHTTERHGGSPATEPNNTRVRRAAA